MNELMEVGKSVKLELTRSTVVTPKNYNFENAMISASLIIAETVDRNKRPALEVCSPENVKKAILSMAVQGLNPAKNQCYFVVYGTQLQCVRSYMGAQMTAKLCDPRVADIRAQIIYQGDQLEIDIVNGRDVIKSHRRSFDAMSKADIIGAYAIAVGRDERDHLYAEIMGIEEIKQSWKQSKMNAVAASGTINADSTHGKFTGEMAKRTVINRLCKRIINTSDDSALLAAFESSDEERPQAELIAEEIRQNGNQKLLDFETPPPVQADPIPQGPVMVSIDTRKKIIEMEKAARRDREKSLENISGFIGREVSQTKELTEAEAQSYISAMAAELEEAVTPPPWAE